MADGEGCVCGAHGACECGCDADWTPRELITAREEITRLKAALATNAYQRDLDYQAEIERLRLTTEEREALWVLVSHNLDNPTFGCFAATLAKLLERIK